VGLTHPEQGQAFYNGKEMTSTWASTRSLRSERKRKN